jgi:Flp pilus assembly protein TadG
MVEMVLVAVILFYLCFGMIEFGYCFYVENTMEGAAREGCRAAIVNGAAYSDITTALNNALSTAGLPSTGYSLTVQDNGSTVTSSSFAGNAGDTISVKITWTWGVIGAGFSPLQLMPKAKVISATCVMIKDE